jgi:hypothetical protein
MRPLLVRATTSYLGPSKLSSLGIWGWLRESKAPGKSLQTGGDQQNILLILVYTTATMSEHLPLVTLSSIRSARNSMPPSSSGVNVARSTDLVVDFSWLRLLAVPPSPPHQHEYRRDAFSSEVALLMLLSDRLRRVMPLDSVVRTGSIRSRSSSNLCMLCIHASTIAINSPSEKDCIISQDFRIFGSVKMTKVWIETRSNFTLIRPRNV